MVQPGFSPGLQTSRSRLKPLCREARLKPACIGEISSRPTSSSWWQTGSRLKPTDFDGGARRFAAAGYAGKGWLFRNQALVRGANHDDHAARVSLGDLYQGHVERRDLQPDLW
jgi:hypothetical protein